MMHKLETLKLLGHLRHITRPYKLGMSCDIALLPYTPKTVTWPPECVTQ